MGNDKTSWLFENDDDLDSEDLSQATDFTETLDGNGNNAETDLATDSYQEAKTAFIQSEAVSDKTAIFLNPEDDAEIPKLNSLADPVVGWLVVVKGPGVGNSVALGSGMNVVGRSSDERVPMDFGDALISNKDHVRIIYDDEGRNFLIAPGAGKNMSRINRKMVMTPMPMENYSIIQFSKQTFVRFVAFCNDDFDWQDLAKAEAAAQAK